MRPFRGCRQIGYGACPGCRAPGRGVRPSPGAERWSVVRRCAVPAPPVRAAGDGRTPVPGQRKSMEPEVPSGGDGSLCHPNRRVSAARRPPRATAFGKLPGRPPTATEFPSRRARRTGFGRENPSPRPLRQRDRRPTTKPERRRSRRSGFSRKNNCAPAR